MMVCYYQNIMCFSPELLVFSALPAHQYERNHYLFLLHVHSILFINLCGVCLCKRLTK